MGGFGAFTGLRKAMIIAKSCGFIWIICSVYSLRFNAIRNQGLRCLCFLSFNTFKFSILFWRVTKFDRDVMTDLLFWWLQIFSEPKWKLEIVVQYLWKYITKVIQQLDLDFLNKSFNYIIMIYFIFKEKGSLVVVAFHTWCLLSYSVLF